MSDTSAGPLTQLTRWRIGVKAYGIVFLLVLALLVGPRRSRSFQKRFTPVVMVTLETDRLGSQLQESSDVKLRGLLVGEVRQRRGHPDGSASRAGAPARRGRQDPVERQRPAAAQDPLRRALRRPRHRRATRRGPIRAGDTHPAGPQPRVHRARDGPRQPLPAAAHRAAGQARDHAQRPVDDARRPRRPDRSQPRARRPLPQGAQPQHADDPDRTSRCSPTPQTSTPASRPTSSGSPSRCASRTRRSSRRTSSSRPSSSARPVSPTTRPGSCATTSSASSRSARSASRPSQLLAEYSPIYPCVASGLVNWLPARQRGLRRRHLPHHARGRAAPTAVPAGGGAPLGRHARPALLRPAHRPTGRSRTPSPATTSTTAPSRASDRDALLGRARRRCSATPPLPTPAAPARPTSSASSGPCSPVTASRPTAARAASRPCSPGR